MNEKKTVACRVDVRQGAAYIAMNMDHVKHDTRHMKTCQYAFKGFLSVFNFHRH
jgi:uncharacterized membrane protein